MGRLPRRRNDRSGPRRHPQPQPERRQDPAPSCQMRHQVIRARLALADQDSQDQRSNDQDDPQAVERQLAQ